MSTIPLAKGFNADKMTWPCLVSLKIDGCPVRVDIGADYKVTVQTRQGKPVPSVEYMIMDWVNHLKFSGDFVPPMTFVMEMAQEDIFAPFKDTSGIFRKQQVTCQLNGWIFDWQGPERYGYADRMRVLKNHLPSGMKIRLVEFFWGWSEKELQDKLSELVETEPRAEGFVARDRNDGFEPGKRSWGYQKVLYEPTIDLRIVGFEEATTADGEPKGMVGRLIAEYNGNQIGIGPGKLTHKERVDLYKGWLTRPYGSTQFGVALPKIRIAQIKYKKDDSYDALRQPTFQHWRDDKDEPDA